MRLNRTLAFLSILGVVAVFASAPTTQAKGQKWYERAVKKVEGSFTPAEAKPGQTVTFSVTVELNEGFHTYPTLQVDKMAAGMVNVFKFPSTGPVIFVGTVQDPKDPKSKAEPDAGIMKLLYYPGTATYTRKAVVSPKAATGPAEVKLSGFKLSVCDKDNCFPPKDVPVEAKLKVLEGSVEVEKQYAEEVAKALGAK
ncbi:MAG: hypothetical protein C0467_11380 [Planctomycetaceae bacterium]|nr:hypothetical protein [Planctomycetaceae bacterium]